MDWEFGLGLDNKDVVSPIGLLLLRRFDKRLGALGCDAALPLPYFGIYNQNSEL